MEFTKMLVCFAIIAMVMVDVMTAAPLNLDSAELAKIENTIVKDVEAIIQKKSARRNRRRRHLSGRRRRHTMPHNFYRMELCIMRPRTCAHRRNRRPTARPSVVIIEK